ncbi:MAG: hypothetical protein ACH34Y_00835 [Brachymonas sp.]|jgi:membrane protein implicated in regulation of membrane protease activity
MWGKLAQLFFRRPDLVLGHIEAYAEQASREYDSFKQGLGLSLLGLLISAFLLALALALLAFAAMLDLALVAIAQPVWLYALPAGLLLVAALLLAYFLRQLQARGQASQIKQQLQADFAVLRDLAQKKPKEM